MNQKIIKKTSKTEKSKLLDNQLQEYGSIEYARKIEENRIIKSNLTTNGYLEVLVLKKFCYELSILMQNILKNKTIFDDNSLFFMIRPEI